MAVINMGKTSKKNPPEIPKSKRVAFVKAPDNSDDSIEEPQQKMPHKRDREDKTKEKAKKTEPEGKAKEDNKKKKTENSSEYSDSDSDSPPKKTKKSSAHTPKQSSKPQKSKATEEEPHKRTNKKPKTQEEPKVKKNTKKPKTPSESSSEEPKFDVKHRKEASSSESSESPKKKSKKPVTPPSSDSSSSEAAKKPSQKQSKKPSPSSSSSSSSSSGEVAKKPAGKSPPDSSSSSEVPQKPTVKPAASSSSSSSSEPPSKKKVKKPPPPPSSSSSSSSEEPARLKRKLAEDSPPAKKQHSGPAVESEIFIGGLPYTATEKQIQSHFSGCGEILSFKLLRNEHGDSKGLGFLKFSSEEASQKAIDEFNNSDFMGRYIRVNLANANANANANARGSPNKTDNPGVSTIFVGNLPYSCTEDELGEVFSYCGTIKAVRIARDAEGNAKGFGHVEFTEPTGASKAVSQGGELAGRSLKLDFAQEKRPGNTMRPSELRPGRAEDKPKEKLKRSGVIQEFTGVKRVF